jgi:hypothetical protein
MSSSSESWGGDSMMKEVDSLEDISRAGRDELLGMVFAAASLLRELAREVLQMCYSEVVSLTYAMEDSSASGIMKSGGVL